ncbi:MAG: 23S rRNA (adenine(2503)-C(2))-methyltransferase RlmN [Candidatus Latescibacterota bacterium]|jgi:23S rRNA (adenine2503-C2)-methyltransferase|nr:MAG: 23S rRNA (adenine(2503)-C(2))-methyltransferase RlmN [Candidatus Latescibacterota bacterium]
MEKRIIKDLSADELAAAMAAMGEKRHRAVQIIKWLYQKGAASFAEMTNLPRDLRERLDERFVVTAPRLVESIRSGADASQKFLLETADGALVETVLMVADGHRTICVSSQAGCALGCSFCRTGEGGFERDLTSGEILGQVLFFKSGYLPPRRRFNIVFMGMGEPLLNMRNLAAAIEILNMEAGFGLGEKRITVSTVGIPAGIRELAATDLRFSLAVSLNATTDESRRRLMPAARDLGDTLAAAREFARARRARVTLEYVLIAGENDSDEDARRLAALSSGGPFKINLIPFNEWDGCEHRRPGEDRIERFIGLLLPTAPAVTVRRSQGRDIGAACGQLRRRRLSRG